MGKQKKHPKGKKGGGRFPLKVLIVLAVLGVAGGFFFFRSGSEGPKGSKVAARGALVRKETRPTLSPSLFVGKVAWAYEVAREIPEVLDQLYCYCYCDKHSGHKSLLSCYTDGHAADCDICMDEALEASRLYKQGKSVQEIRAKIDRQFARW